MSTLGLQNRTTSSFDKVRLRRVRLRTIRPRVLLLLRHLTLATHVATTARLRLQDFTPKFYSLINMAEADAKMEKFLALKAEKEKLQRRGILASRVESRRFDAGRNPCTGSSKTAGRARAARPRGFLPKTSRQGHARLCTRPSRHATRLLPNTRSVRQIVCLLVSYMPLGIIQSRSHYCSSSHANPPSCLKSAPREPCAQQHCCCSRHSMQQPPRASPETNGKPKRKKPSTTHDRSGPKHQTAACSPSPVIV